MATKVITYTTTTDAITGLGAISIQIPGTFNTIDSTSPDFTGRQLYKLGAWLESRAVGDKIISIEVKDTDGIILAPGTVVAYVEDHTVPSDNQGVTLPPGGLPFVIEFPNTAKAKIPSQLYIVITFKKAAAGVDTACVNIAWDDLS